VDEPDAVPSPGLLLTFFKIVFYIRLWAEFKLFHVFLCDGDVWNDDLFEERGEILLHELSLLRVVEDLSQVFDGMLNQFRALLGWLDFI